MTGQKEKPQKTNSLVVINIVGLTPALLGQDTPHLNNLIEEGFIAQLESSFPAVTSTAQASMLTGSYPSEHGIVANGWYFRELAEVMFWRQANQLVAGEKIWQTAQQQQESFSCAQLFWWYNMYADVDWSVTPRPIYPADGRKIPGLYSSPTNFHEQLESKLGAFPFFQFWGPAAGLASSQWIADSAREVFDAQQPNLMLVYLPHLDYNLQRLGPDDPAIWKDVQKIDTVAGELIEHFRAQGVDVMVVSEYGIEQAYGHVHINRLLREAGYLTVRETLGWELLDYGASRAFAVADHQVAHVYIKDAKDRAAVARLLRSISGIEQVLDDQTKSEWHVDHSRSGELIAVAEPGHWFTYYYWLDENKAPDFARTVDIHRKPGYDPLELFLDPDISAVKTKIAWRVLQKKLGMRMLMDVIPLKPELVKGTHGRSITGNNGPLLISNRRDFAIDNLTMPEVKALMLKHCF